MLDTQQNSTLSNCWDGPCFLSLHKSALEVLLTKTDLFPLFIRSGYLNGEIFITANGRIIDCHDLIIFNRTEVFAHEPESVYFVNKSIDSVLES